MSSPGGKKKYRITFQKPFSLPPHGTVVVMVYPFTIVDTSFINTPRQKSQTTHHQITVSATLSLVASWGLTIARNDPRFVHDASTLIKIMFEYGREYINSKMKKRSSIMHDEVLDLDTYNNETPCPFDASIIQNPDGAFFEVEIENENEFSVSNRGRNVTIAGDVSNTTIITGDDNRVTNTQNIFAPVYQAIEQSSRPYQEKADLAEVVREVEAEVQKADAADFSFLETRLRNLKRMAPDIFELILSASGGPGAVLGTLLRKVAEKVKSEV